MSSYTIIRTDRGRQVIGWSNSGPSARRMVRDHKSAYPNRAYCVETPDGDVIDSMDDCRLDYSEPPGGPVAEREMRRSATVCRLHSMGATVGSETAAAWAEEDSRLNGWT